MPELPEVETIARVLRDGNGEYQVSIIGCKITDAKLLWARTLAVPDPDVFFKEIIGQKVSAVTRRGKFLVFSLTHHTLLVHLRMSGDMRVEPAIDSKGNTKPFEKHDRLALMLNGGNRMVFNDTRKFGRVWLVEDPEIVVGRLGPEPLQDGLSAGKFYGMLQTHKRQLKPLLMDQRFLAGLGNIYTDEALHIARLHPLEHSNQLSLEEAGGLLAAIRQVLSEGIRRNGSSIDWVYRGGEYQNHFSVYGRTGSPCPNCGALIERLLVGQRGTHICPVCQRLG